MSHEFSHDMKTVLEKAEAIKDETSLLASDPRVKELIVAAEEAGLDRNAVLQALREILSDKGQQLAIEYKVGELVFAKSNDGCYYPAFVQGIESGMLSVRFASGGQDKMPSEDIRMFRMAPGANVEYRSSESGGWWMKAEVQQFNPETRTTTLSYWGSRQMVPLEMLRLPKEKAAFSFTTQLQQRAMVLAIALGGSVIGAALVLILVRR